jgi:SecD/SecF fusion protein
MEKQKRWQYYLIVAVIFLTVYNILPTVFYYTKPLKSPIDEKRAEAIATSTAKRVNALEAQAEEWIDSFCDLIHVKPLSIKLDPAQPQFISVNFKNVEDANHFRKQLPRAGLLIPFVPAQLSTYDSEDHSQKSVLVQRRIPIHFDESQMGQYYQYSTKFDKLGSPTPLYRALVDDRALQIAIALGGTSENALAAQGMMRSSGNWEDKAVDLSQNILSFTKVYGENSEAAKRFFSSFSQIGDVDKTQFIQDFSSRLEQLAQSLKREKNSLVAENDLLKTRGEFLDIIKQQRLDLLTTREKAVQGAHAIVVRNAKVFSSGLTPWNFASLGTQLQQSAQQKTEVQTLSLEGRNPFIDAIAIDWSNEKISLIAYQDLTAFSDSSSNYIRDLADQLLYNEIAFVARQTGEEIIPSMGKFSVALSQLTHSKSFIAWKLSSIAQAQTKQLKETLTSSWNPKHPDLSHEHLPIYDYDTYVSLPQDEQKLALVIYSPALYKKAPPRGFHMNSIYVIAKGMDRIVQRQESDGKSPQATQFAQEFNQLRNILLNNGFVGYSATTFGLSSEFAQDFVFEAEDYFQTVIKATRENFSVHGTKRYAILEFTDVEQRLLTENKIDNHIHEDLLKWRDDYYAAQLNIKGLAKTDVPKPTQNVYWDNFKLSFVKYFRGDDRKILHWGLDLSGGKTVQIELRDTNNRLVTNEDDIKQGINELYNRVNKMGVSEVSIRQEGNYITLDFPGSQGLSAAELVKASSMYFHVVNEKFTQKNRSLSDAVNRFLQDIWNEAVVTNRKTAEEINLIAWKHMHGDSLDPDAVQPRSEAARILHENGLRFANPQDPISTSIFSETFSKIALFRGDNPTDWQGQTYPLIIVFQNYALEGSNLDQVHAGYDPSKGNFLSFSIKGSYSAKDGQKIQPRENVYAWTSQFAKEKITGTPLEVFSNGQGWRMVVILNGTIISSPTLDAAFKDSAMITGSFTQREVNQLEADLKAGSLSFTPHILSEKNVSPELGVKEKRNGVISTLFSLVLVVGVMIGYYRFGGLVASVAVLFNLLIMWATLQNLEATMTLAGIAGIILTVGMAVDANVLVFERIREEFAISGRIASAVHAGYKKAFSAILDSNVTTIIAAMVLLHFDSGPIKGLAITLTIGIISSMFTALFMTRFFFASWVQNPSNKHLSMLNWFKARGYDFLKYTKLTLMLSSIIVLLGSYMLIHEKNSIFGMDFSGGYALNVDLQLQPHENYRQAVEQALIRHGASAQEIQIRELTPSNHIRIFLSRSLQQPGRPFYGMPFEVEGSDIAYPFQSNPKISWVVEALNKSGIALNPQSLSSLDKNWTEVSGQMSDSMRNNAIIGLSVALLCILIYITLRFEFKYAISATLCLAHDVVFTLGTMGILHALGIPIQIDLNTVAALMTMVGYSLNDTIIVFDRIREDVRLMRKSSFSEIINHALNVTLSRTVLTSGTTLLVLIPLIFLGGSTLFGFALVMAIGVIFGTLSSLYIAAPLMKFFHDREEKRHARFLASDSRP